MSWQPHFRCQKAAGVQFAFLRNVCGRLPAGIAAATIYAISELAEDPCSLKWWVQLVEFALRISDLPQGSFHCEILTDNVQDALAKPSSANWAAQVADLGKLSMSGHWACQHLLLMVVQFSLKSPAFVTMRLANLMRSGRACMLLLDLRPAKGQSCAHTIVGLRALVPCQSRTFSCP